MDCLGGKQLRKLDFIECDDIEPVVELLPFYKLETLALDRCNLTALTDAIDLAEKVPQADCGNQFLPNLTSLKVEKTCLGQWSRLFECYRPLLAELHLFCCHVALPCSVSEFIWSDTTQLWPNLRILEFCNSDDGVILNALKSIAPHLHLFHRLEEFIIPENVYTAVQPLSLLPKELTCVVNNYHFYMYYYLGNGCLFKQLNQDHHQ
jgi:hypothetical protein